MMNCPKCGAAPKGLHAAHCQNRPKKNIRTVADPRAGRTVIVDPGVQAIRDRSKNLMGRDPAVEIE